MNIGVSRTLSFGVGGLNQHKIMIILYCQNLVKAKYLAYPSIKIEVKKKCPVFKKLYICLVMSRENYIFYMQ